MHGYLAQRSPALKSHGEPRVLSGLWCFAACLTFQQHASVSQGRIFSDSCTCCHTEIEAAGQTCCLNHPQYTDTIPSVWQVSYWSAYFKCVTRPGSLKIHGESGNRTQVCSSRGGRLTTRLTSGRRRRRRRRRRRSMQNFGNAVWISGKDRLTASHSIFFLCTTH